MQRICETEIGKLLIECSAVGITAIKMMKEDLRVEAVENELLDRAAEQLEAYFAGARKQFDFPLDLRVGTAFQQKVWQALRTIPYGKTISYLQLAQGLGDRKAVRAVGTANGRNPIMIVVPCHRVIGADGSLTGYASGVDIKEKLLRLENPKTFGLQGVIPF